MPDTTEQILYIEDNATMSTTVFIVLMAILALCFLVGFFTSAIFFVIGLIGPICVWGYWIIGNASRLKVTSTHIVGARASVALSEIDTSFGIQPASTLLTELQQWQLPRRGLRGASDPAKVLGGAFNRKTIKTDLVLLKTLTSPDQPYLVAVRDVDRFKAIVLGQ